MSGGIREMVLAAISQTNSFDEMGRRLVETCAELFDAEVCSLWRRFHDEDGRDRLRLLAASMQEPQTGAEEITYEIMSDDPEGRRADGVTGYVAQTGREVHVSSYEQLQNEYKFCWRGQWDKKQWRGEPQKRFKSLSSFPVRLGNDVIGVFKLENRRNSMTGFPEDVRRAVRELAPDIALALHSFRLLEPREQRLIQVPAKMVARLLQPFEPQRLVSEIVKAVAENLHAEICSLWLIDSTGKQLRLADGFGFSTKAQAELIYIVADATADDNDIDGITAWVAVRKKPFWAKSWDELKKHPSWKGKWDAAIWPPGERRFRCLYAVPLLGERGTVFGVLRVENRRGQPFFTETDRALCGIMASLIVLTLELGQRVRTSLISDLVHLIRSPIGQVPMNLSGLEREIRRVSEGLVPRPDIIHGYVDVIKKALMAAMVPTRALAAFSTRASGLVARRQPEAVSLVEIVNNRLTETEQLLYGGIKIERDFSADIKNAMVVLDVVDRTGFGIALDNVLHNAIKYSRKNGTVHVSLRRYEQGAVLTIRDEGQGISPEDLPRIWDPGFSRRAVDHPEGTGMGLTTVKQVLERLDWKGNVESEIGRGTTFTIYLPVNKE